MHNNERKRVFLSDLITVPSLLAVYNSSCSFLFLVRSSFAALKYTRVLWVIQEGLRSEEAGRY